MKIIKSFNYETGPAAHDITEAFGIDGAFENKVLDIDIPDEIFVKGILLVTGESGCGKSTLLREMGYFDYGHPNTMEKTMPLYKWGEYHKVNLEETLKILSLVGLGDAQMFLSRYFDLSDSQQARARIAWQIISSGKIVIVDEFLATLDRGTAKAVAFSIQKAARKAGIRLWVATANDDIEPYLRPDYTIRGQAFPSRWKVEAKIWPRDNPITELIKYEYMDKNWYREERLGELHYKGKYAGGVKEYLRASLNDRTIGVLVATYRMGGSPDARRISRLVVHPTYRGCGVGQGLVRYYLSTHGNTDVVAAMARFNPVFERAGMVRVKDIIRDAPDNLEKHLVAAGFDTSRWHELPHCEQFCNRVENRKPLGAWSEYAKILYQPGGKKLTAREIAAKMAEDWTICGRILWNWRPRKLAKYKSASMK